MKNFPFLSASQAVILLRVIVALLLIIHGVTRILHDGVGGFGGFLDSQGIPAGTVVAWGITLFEIAGGLLMALGRYTRWIAAAFALELTMGILLVHAKNGWFVVGGGSNGVEYSVLLITCMIVIAAQSKGRN
ncbi:DoxX family protein [Chryseolinea soli]|uniref:DoxX family protein n=1 Tax=Chryseolinea soli TaxID=2321403 RepID=A0A385SNM4_9BACT|nr:DoxX family protein [Chryseolinea soli]AYB30588.1 DoxX family protein [Chryseolinea soli]